MTDLQARTLSGIKWTLAGQLSRQVVTFGLGILLARLLIPDDFGLVAMVMVFQGFAALFLEFGFGAAIVQRSDIQERHVSSVFWLNVAIGAALAAVFAAAAPTVAWFFDEPRLVAVTRVMAIGFLINPLGIVPRTLAQKQLRFRKIATIDFIATFVSIVVAVVLAWQGYGVWSLVVQAMLNGALQVAAYWYLSHWRPHFMFDVQALRELSHFSTHFMGTRVLTYWGHNLDYLIIGKALGATPLGFYQKAYSLVSLPMANVSRVMNQVLFPAYAQRQDDDQTLQNAHRQAVRVNALIVFPIAATLFLTAEPLVIALYTTKWDDMVPVLRVLSLIVPLVTIRHLYGNIFLAKGRSDIQFRLQLVMKAITIAAIFIGVQWGLVGVAIGITAAVAVNALPQLILSGRLIGMRLAYLGKDILPPLVATLTMGVILYAVRSQVPLTWLPWQRLPFLLATAMASYAAIVIGLRLRAFSELKGLALRGRV